jgi:hypothetical protein
MAAQIGTVRNLVGGTMVLEMPRKVNYWFIQNQSNSHLKVDFESGTTYGEFTSIVLTPANVQGGAGGFLDSIGFPFFGNVTLTSVDPTAQFGSGASGWTPNNIFVYPGNQGGNGQPQF